MHLADQQRAHLQHLTRAYADALEQHAFDGVLLFSGRPVRHHGDDQYASFAAFGHFVHWTGQAHLAHSWLLVRPGQRPTLFLYAPDDFWHLPARLPDEPWVDDLHVVPQSTLAPPALPPGRHALLGNMTRAEAAALGAELNPPALLARLDELRVHKSEYEVACVSEANRRATLGHSAARDAFLAGGAELDIQLAYLSAVRQRESELPYANIVALNAHGGVLHYQHYDDTSPPHTRSLLLDGGCRYRGYCADVTRTWSGPDAASEFAPLVEGVTGLQQRLIESLTPGICYAALHERMHEELATLLTEQGLYRGSAEAALASGVTRAFCPHGLGHLLGVQVHDVAGLTAADGTPLPPPADHPALRLTRPLEAGMIVTIEPGLYVIPMLLAPHRQRKELDWALIQRLAEHGGIRIEDNLLITKSGHRNLTPRITP